MQVTLTPEDRALLEASAAIMQRLVAGPVCSVGITFIGGDRAKRGFFSISASDVHESFSGAYGSKPADVSASVEEALNKVHEANPDEEARKAKRIAELREQLSRLEGEAA